MLQALSLLRLIPALFLVLAIGCKTDPAGTSSDVQSSTDPVVRTENSKSDLPEFVMTNELPDVSRRLTNNLNTCWLQAGLKELEITYYRESGGKEAMPFSAEYTMQAALHDRFLRIVQGSRVRSAELEAGGEINEVRVLIEKYGLVPEKTWGDPANKWGDMAKELNPIASKLRKKFLDHQSRGTSTDGVMEEAEAALEAVYEAYDVHVPTWFLDHGERTDPVTFANSFVKDEAQSFVMFIARPMFPQKPNKADLLTVQDSYRTSWENIEKTIVHEIDRGASVVTAIYWSEKGIKVGKNGLMTVKLPLSKELEGHVVNIVGYHLNDKGRPDRLKIENSWGRYSGAAGYYSVPWEDLKLIFQGISVPNGFEFAAEQGMIGEKILD